MDEEISVTVHRSAKNFAVTKAQPKTPQVRMIQIKVRKLEEDDTENPDDGSPDQNSYRSSDIKIERTPRRVTIQVPRHPSKENKLKGKEPGYKIVPQISPLTERPGTFMNAARTKHGDIDDEEKAFYKQKDGTFLYGHSAKFSDGPTPDEQTKPPHHNEHNYGKKPKKKRDFRNYQRPNDDATCEVCGLTMRKRSLRGHMRIHTGEKPFECDVCKESFRYKDTLQKHKLEHTADPRPFKCPHCPCDYFSAKYLSWHIRDKHPDPSVNSEWYEDPKKTVLCELCAKMFTPWGIRNHMKLSHPNGEIFKEKTKSTTKKIWKPKPKKSSGFWFPCPFCAGLYSNQHSLSMHISNIHKEEDFQEAFDVQPEFIPVKRSHLYKWGYGLLKTCCVCQKSVSRLSFRKHLLSHRGEKSHQCSVCDATFHYAGSLKLHEKCHDKNKPASTKQLLRPKHEILPYKCKTCSKKFATCAMMRKHEFRHGVRVPTKWMPKSCIMSLPADFKETSTYSRRRGKGRPPGFNQFWSAKDGLTQSKITNEDDTNALNTETAPSASSAPVLSVQNVHVVKTEPLPESSEASAAIEALVHSQGVVPGQLVQVIDPSSLQEFDFTTLQFEEIEAIAGVTFNLPK